MKYFANMSVNNGTRFQKNLEDTNKKRLVSTIYNSAKANRFQGQGSEAHWWVHDENGKCVAAGWIMDWGSYRVPEDELYMEDVQF